MDGELTGQADGYLTTLVYKIITRCIALKELDAITMAINTCGVFQQYRVYCECVKERVP